MIQYKEWDSNFFEKKTGSISRNVLINASIGDKITEEIENGQYKFLYYFHDLSIESHTQPDIKALAQLGFKYIDTHGSFALDLSKVQPPLETSYSIFIVNNPNEINRVKLEHLVKELSVVGRFYLDSECPRDKATELYQTWLDKSFSKEMADWVYIIGDKENPLGFVTLKRVDDDEIDLSLIVVDESMRGKGVGKLLALSALSDFKGKFKRCSVKVSLSNVSAVRFYESLEFTLTKSYQIYHAHLN